MKSRLSSNTLPLRRRNSPIWQVTTNSRSYLRILNDDDSGIYSFIEQARCSSRILLSDPESFPDRRVGHLLARNIAQARMQIAGPYAIFLIHRELHDRDDFFIFREVIKYGHLFG